MIHQTISNSSVLQYTINATLVKQPKLVTITTSGTYIIDRNYKYIDLLLVGAGGKGFAGTDRNGGGGGTSGAMLYVKDIPASEIIANESSIEIGTANTQLIYDDKYFLVPVGVDAIGTDGGSSNISSKLRVPANFSYRCVSQGGGAGADGVLTSKGVSGGQGGGMSNYGANPIGNTGGDSENGGDGKGAYGGGESNYFESAGQGDVKTNLPNSTIIPLKSIFNGTGKGGKGGNMNASIGAGGGGGGAGGYGDGGYGGFAYSSSGGQYGAGGGGGSAYNSATKAPGAGGQGIVLFYYHD